jgi:hypothetical protein
MKVSAPCAFLLSAILAATSPGGFGQAEVTVEALGVTGERPKTPLPELHFFGGRPVELDLAVEAPLGAKVAFTAVLWQVAGGIAAPLGPEVALGDAVEFDHQTRRIIHVSLPLPEVVRRSELRVRFRAQVAGEEKKTGAGAARLFVYPKNPLKDFAAALDRMEKDTGASLGVFGESKRLRAFLKQSEIAFTDAGTAFPGNPGKRVLLIGEADARTVQTRDLSGTRVIFFTADPALLPGVYTTRSGSALLTTVTLPILNSLATNPQSQETFLQVLRQSLDAPAGTTPESP